jgi:hypothetical protein
MATFILSLGTLVNTNFQKSVMAFVALAEKQVDLKIIIPQLGPLFQQFNLGKLSTEDLKNALEEALGIKMQLDEFLSAWNAMCEVDDAALKMIKLIHAINASKNPALSIRIYSDTNPEHLSFLQKNTQQLGDKLPKIDTTFKHQLSKADLLKKVVQDEKLADPAAKICVLIGNNDKIAESTLAQMVVERDAAIVAASVTLESPIECIKLEGSSLTVEKLLAVMSEKSGLSIEAINEMITPPKTYGAEQLAAINAALISEQPAGNSAALEVVGNVVSLIIERATTDSNATPEGTTPRHTSNVGNFQNNGSS